MAITKIRSGYLVHIAKKGLPRVRKTFPTLRMAEQFEHEYLGAQHKADKAIGTDQPVALSPTNQVDNRSLFALLDVWFKFHGVNLSDGARRRVILEATFSRLEVERAIDLTPERWLEYRYQQMYKIDKPITGKTLNNRLQYVQAMFRTLKKLKIIDYPCPIADVEQLKLHERQVSYLSDSQIELLFDELKRCRNKSVWWIAQICIRTGARWGEAESLKRKQLHNERITYVFTKSKKVRTVPIDADFYAELLYFSRIREPEERIFKNSMTAFNRVVHRLNMRLPKGQKTHILRHSFASHFMMNGGNILTLQKILGHADIKQTMHYAHLSPNHLNDATIYNPMSKNRKTTF